MVFSWHSTAVLGLLARCIVAAPGHTAALSNSTATTTRGTAIPTGYTPSPPVPPPKYMVDNQKNYFHAAPDKYSPELIDVIPSPNISTSVVFQRDGPSFDVLENRQATGSSYWLANMGHGTVRLPRHLTL
jgi:hypothetical protein